jgi:ABC-type antimicrobial peptide transport system permease subunit
MDLMVFIFAAAITIGAAFFFISFQSIRAARANPVDSLRYE